MTYGFITPKRQTAWLEADDGFLVIDRNLNGSIDSGKGLFANGAAGNFYYQNRSCLRTYLLGYSNKTHLKTGRYCSKVASGKARKIKTARQQADSVIKSSRGRLFKGVSSY